MIKEGIWYENGKSRLRVGVEILAQPWLYVSNEELFRVINEEMDFKVFSMHLNAVEPEILNFINIKPSTLIKYGDEIGHLVSNRPNVVIELSEDFIESGELTRIARLKKEHRFKICIDDFGRNSSNLDRLITLTPEFLKIDLQMFPSLKGVQTIVEIVSEISPTTRLIAERVEHENDLNFAKSLGIKLWQGHLEKLLINYLQKPIESDKFLEGGE